MGVFTSQQGGQSNAPQATATLPKEVSTMSGKMSHGCLLGKSVISQNWRKQKLVNKHKLIQVEQNAAGLWQAVLLHVGG